MNVISSSDDEALDKEDTSKHERIDEINVDEDIALMIIDTIVDVAQVTTAIVDVLVSAAEAIVTTAPTITVESKKIEVKQKMEDDKESAELKKCLEIIPDNGDDVAVDATPLSSIKFLKNFDREDLKVLWRLVKERFVKTMPVDDMDSFLLHTLKTMFEHHVEDNNILYYLLGEKMYPLTNHTLHHMSNDMKLQVDDECEMAYELLKLVKKQLKEEYKAN
nr:hypothetical protein [Tanacetum cinerariifolium]